MWKFRLARFARSRKLPCQNIVKKCDDNNYTNSIVMKIMITNTSARPMCKASTLICCRFIWYPSPHTKKLATPLMSPWQKKKSWAPLGLCPPPPPPQSKTASGAPGQRPSCQTRSKAFLKSTKLWEQLIGVDLFSWLGGGGVIGIWNPRRGGSEGTFSQIRV